MNSNSAVRAAPVTLSPKSERAVHIVGIGTSDFGQLFPDQNRYSTEDLAVLAIREALQDAGIRPQSVDSVLAAGLRGVPRWLKTLGMEEVGHFSAQYGSGHSSVNAIMDAACYIAAGASDIVCCVFSARYRTDRTNFDVLGSEESFRPWTLYGMASPGASYAAMWNSYLTTYGLVDRADELAAVPIVQRAHAASNPRAVFRTPLSLDDYAKAPYIVEPLKRPDYCTPADGAVALIFASAPRASATRHPVSLRSIACLCCLPDIDFIQLDYERGAIKRSVAMALSAAGISLADVDVLQIYDHFSPVVLFALEGAGACGYGEALDFIRRGETIKVGGPLPVNTAGGNLAEGYFQGWGHVAEAVRQVRGERAGAGAVPDCSVVLYVASTGGAMVITEV